MKDIVSVVTIFFLAGFAIAYTTKQKGLGFVGNLLWLTLGGGLIIALEYILGGLILCLTVVGLPFGLQNFKIATLALLPFDSKITNKGSIPVGCISAILNILWILFGGIWIALTHLIFALLTAITVVGIPFAHQHLKLAVIALAPFGKKIEKG